MNEDFCIIWSVNRRTKLETETPLKASQTITLSTSVSPNEMLSGSGTATNYNRMSNEEEAWSRPAPHTLRFKAELSIHPRFPWLVRSKIKRRCQLQFHLSLVVSSPRSWKHARELEKRSRDIFPIGRSISYRDDSFFFIHSIGVKTTLTSRRTGIRGIYNLLLINA